VPLPQLAVGCCQALLQGHAAGAHQSIGSL
jgi:hypothetical protein